MLFDRRLLKSFSWSLLCITLAVIIVGLPIMFSASQAKEGSGGLFAEHLVRLLIGLVFMIVFMLIDYHFIARYAYLLYALNIGALVFVAFSGVIGFGARRWLQIGPVALQPSEIFKITLILVLANFLAGSRQWGGLRGRNLMLTLLLLLPPLLLILKQPDLGTAGIVCLIYLTMVALAGISARTWSLLLRSAMVLALVCFMTMKLNIVKMENFLKPYQIKRIKVLFNPELDPLGASYHINQSKIAIGSGGLMGKGFLNGTQNQLRFLPQQHTDFIFSVLAEEWGFLGVFIVMILYFMLIFIALQVARDAKDPMGAMIALGVGALVFYHTVINIGMTVGFMPVVGLPLPFMSYGGSSFMVMMMGVGLLLNVRMRRFIL